MRTMLLVVLGLSTLSSACRRQVEVGTGTPGARATVRTPSGASLGELTFAQNGNGVHITGTLVGLAPGAHGFHLHQVGRCEPAEFTSAGGHLNPAGRRHGLENPAGPHAGDMPNIMADASGRAVVDVTTDRVTLDPAGPLFDLDGTAIVVHAAPDDQRTDPAGSAGARVGCGVIVRR